MVSLNKYLELVKKKYPEVDQEDLQIFDDGFDYLVIVANEKYAFRFPRKNEYAEGLEKEVAFVNDLAKNSPVPVPRMKYLSDEKLGPHAAYDFISGTQFSRKLAKQFTNKERYEVARMLGLFLSYLHSFPPEKVIGLQRNRFETLDDWRKKLVNVRNIVFPILSNREKLWAEKLFESFFITFKKSSFVPRVIHGDIMPEHIIVGPKSHNLVGVIDFSDVSVGDPAYDFAFLFRYGKDFLVETYKNYKLQKDEYFEERRKFYDQRMYVTNLEHSLIRKEEENLKIQLKQLRDFLKNED